MSFQSQFGAAKQRQLSRAIRETTEAMNALNHQMGTIVATTKTQATGDIHHLRSWAAGKGIRIEGRGRPSKDLIYQYQLDTGRKYVSGKVVNKTVSAQPETARKKVYRPNCPVHKVEMVFDTNDNFFKCPQKSCVIKALPKSEANKPVVGTGVIKLFIDGDGKYYLTADNNVRMDITKIVADSKIESNNRGYPSHASVTLDLYVRKD